VESGLLEDEFDSSVLAPRPAPFSLQKKSGPSNLLSQTLICVAALLASYGAVGRVLRQFDNSWSHPYLYLGVNFPSTDHKAIRLRSWILEFFVSSVTGRVPWASYSTSSREGT
jgi:hypothetical protein